MPQILEFIVNHWMLVSAFVMLVLLLIQTEMSGTVSGVPVISPQQATKMMNHENAFMLDIRDESSYATGHILGAASIPTSELDKNLKKLPKNKNKPIIVVCNAGNSAIGVAQRLRKQAYAKVFVLKGGISAWQNAQLPLTN